MDKTEFTVPATIDDGIFKFDVSGISTMALTCLLLDVAVALAKARDISPVQVLQWAINDAPASLR